MRRFLVLTLACVAVLAAGIYAKREYLLLHVPGWIVRIREPIAPFQAVSWQAGPATPPAGPRPPNVVVILADDLGYNDPSWNGGGVANGAVPTPRIDSIARDGVEFTHGYAGNATCAPSRAAIMTGRYPTRFGFEFTPAPKPFMRLWAHWNEDADPPPLYFWDREKDVPPMEMEGLPAKEITLAELMHGAGYRTLGFGKWHLGQAKAMEPQNRGFDEYLGFTPGASMYLDPDDPNAVGSQQPFDPIDAFLWANLRFWVNKDGGPRFKPDVYMTDYLGREAARAIEANRNRPFFLYFAPNAPHTPLQAAKADYDALPQIQDHELRVYAAMIRALDRNVGLLLDALRANGLENDTLVIFTSDNGGANYIGLPDINRPFRGWKMTFFEGGVHTPFFARWPARLPRGSRFDPPVAHVDIFATAAAAAGVALPADRVYDGVDLVKLVRGDPDTRAREAIYWRSGHYRSILAHDWKLQVSERPKKNWLFDLSTDPTEKTNLADSRPDKLAELRAILDTHDAQMVTPLWPALIEGAIPIDRSLSQPKQPGEEFVYWDN
ncbi:MAG TPA: sulfatase-like hydrolase/transferase [Myxococcota bacterium]|nr:sulfatase-like hydrolase/transferase [Myxococcota bacterium]